MIIRKSTERGHLNFGWLDTYHTFSFGEYHAPEHMGFGDLRVINDDTVAPGAGFPSHPHKNMEIITYILDGVLEHKDNMGNTSQIRVGDVQRMSAGTGVVHSEYNASKMDPVHLLQIWVLPAHKNQAPSYEQKNFSSQEKEGVLRLIGSQEGRDGSVIVDQDIKIYASILNGQPQITYPVSENRIVWVHVARGRVDINKTTFSAGDAIGVQGETLMIENGRASEILLFDMAA